jgi:integrase
MPTKPIKRTIKITDTVRAAALKLPLIPSITKDNETRGFRLIVTTRDAFWSQSLQPRGVDPSTGQRWSVTQHRLGDAKTMPTADARSAALAAKAASQAGKDPHRERLASLASSVAQRSIVLQTVGDAAALYAQAFAARAHLSDRTKRAAAHYVGKAIRLMGVDALAAIDTRAVLLMLDAVEGSRFERRLVFGALNRFMAWCVTRQLIPENPCDGVDRDDRPPPGRSRDHTPSVATIRRVWAAVEHAPDHVRAVIRFLLVLPLRREEAQGLLWSEVDLEGKRITIRAERMRARQAHSLPLSDAALAILAERASCRTADERVFAPPSRSKTINWDYWVTRIRVALDEDKLERSRRFNLHDIRRGFVSALAEGDSESDERGFDVDLLDQLLGHTRKGVFGTYQRSSRWREKKLAMAAWANLVIPSAAARDNVVAIRAR